MGAPLPVNSKVLGTWILLVGILALLDLKNKGVPAGLEPVAVGLLILAIELAMGSNCGVPLNPARDLGPRLFTYVAGWGPEVFRWEMASPGTSLCWALCPRTPALVALLGQRASSKPQSAPLSGPPAPSTLFADTVRFRGRVLGHVLPLRALVSSSAKWASSDNSQGREATPSCLGAPLLQVLGLGAKTPSSWG